MSVLMSIDGSTKSSGVAIFNTETKQLLHYECITASSTEKIKRINKMVSEFERLYKEYNVDTIIMEEPLPDDINNNQVTYKALMYLQAETAIKFYNDFNKKIDEFINVNTWRKVCGITTGVYGVRETVKEQSMQLVKEQFKIAVNDDIADAVCIGWAWMRGLKTATPLPKRKKVVEVSAF